jgi:hypothetical protein
MKNFSYLISHFSFVIANPTTNLSFLAPADCRLLLPTAPAVCGLLGLPPFVVDA